jgi:hypothetical protein
MSLDGLRSSTREPSTSPMARGTKSTGTNQALPSRTGAAGSEMSRPPTDARLWPGESTIVWLRTVTVRPPAAASSATLRSKSRARSSSANISWPASVRAGRGLRPSRERTV